MKAIVKLLVVPALAVAFAAAAHADGILLGSYGSAGTLGNPGFANTALNYVGYSTSATGPFVALKAVNPTYDLTTGLSPWGGPIPPSYWVSEDPNSSVGGGSAPANGYYKYTTTFKADPGKYAGSISMYADDTMQIWLNGQLLVPFKDNSKNGPCAQGPGPGATCDNVYTYTFAWPVDLGANNTLTIIDWQSNSSAAGVDFEAKLVKTPEPTSLLLLGTGLAGLAKLIARKTRSR